MFLTELRIFFNLLIFLFLISAEGYLFAQEQEIKPAQPEQPAAFDFEGTVFVIDAETAQTAKILTEIIGLKEARLFRLSDDNFRLEILCQINRVLTTKTKFINSFELNKIRLLYSERPQTKIFLTESPSPRLFCIDSAALGLGYGFLLPYAIWKDAFPADTSSIIFMIATPAAISALAPALIYGLNLKPTSAQAHSMFHGTIRGFSDGYLLALIAGGSKADPRAAYGTGLALSVAEAGIGIWLSRKMNMAGGKAIMLFNGSSFGYALGASMYGMIFSDKNYGDEQRIMAGMMFLGGAGGFFLGNMLTKYDSYLETDASIFNISTLLFSALAVSIPLAADYNDPRIMSAVGFAGVAGGATASFFITKNKDFSFIDLLVISLSSGLGSGIALVPAIFIPGFNIQKHGLLTAAIGGLTGFAISAGVLSKGAQQRAHHDLDGLSIHLNPAAIAGVFSEDDKPQISKKQKQQPVYPVTGQTFIEIQYRF